jgi:hypothetical protein
LKHSNSVSSFASECESVSGSLNGTVKRFDDGASVGESVNESVNDALNVSTNNVNTFDENSIRNKLMYRRYINPRDEILKVAINGPVVQTFTRQLMKEVSENQRKKSTFNVGLVYCNSYNGTANDLGDCAINDGLLVYDSLNAYNFKPFLFYDIGKDEFIKTIISTLKSPAIDQVCIYFIGHGTQARDMHGEEADGRDELFVFRDGLVRDDKFAEEVVRAYPINMQKKRLILISDCCHSGTVFDTDTIRRSDKGIPVMSISACRDNETAKQDWFGFGDSGATYKGNGVFTHYFWKAVRGSEFGFNMNAEQLMECVNRKTVMWGMRGCVEMSV